MPAASVYDKLPLHEAADNSWTKFAKSKAGARPEVRQQIAAVIRGLKINRNKRVVGMCSISRTKRMAVEPFSLGTWFRALAMYSWYDIFPLK